MEEELQLEKHKKRKIKGNSRISFADDIENSGEEEQENVENNESLEVTYSYWDGAGQRRVIQVCKGDIIGSFFVQFSSNLYLNLEKLEQLLWTICYTGKKILSFLISTAFMN